MTVAKPTCRSGIYLSVEINPDVIQELSKQKLGVKLKNFQLEAVISYLSGTDTIFVAPTGYGKSILFQIAPLAFTLLEQRNKEGNQLSLLTSTPRQSAYHGVSMELELSALSTSFAQISLEEVQVINIQLHIVVVVHWFDLLYNNFW